MPNTPSSSAVSTKSPRRGPVEAKARRGRGKPTRSAKTLDVLAVSDMCVDVVLKGNVRPQFHQVEQIIGDCSIELGGSANIFATQLAKLGARVGVLGWRGRDAFGQFVLRELQVSGVDATWVQLHPSLKTGIGFALTEPDDRAILTYMGTIDATQPEELKERLLADCRHWHIASYFLLESLRSAWLPWLKKCRKSGITTSLDTNWDPQNRWEGVAELLPLVDVFLPNEAEALAIARAPDVRSAARTLARNGPLVVVKRGADGVFAVHGEREWEFDPTASNAAATCVVDSTGAGDNFDAGFLRAWLAGKDVDACIGLGHRCAVSSLAATGGIRGQLQEKLRLPSSKMADRAIKGRGRNR